MQRSLAVGLCVSLAVVGGLAMWPQPAAAAPRPRAAPAVPAAAAPSGSEEVLARALLALLPATLQRQAHLGPEVDPARCLRRAVPPSVVAVGAGVLAAQLDAASRAVLDRLLEHCAATWAGVHAERALAAALATPPHELAFAFAGGDTTGSACYVRVHGASFVVEWLRRRDGRVFAAWRDFERDAAAPWLGDAVSDR